MGPAAGNRDWFVAGYNGNGAPLTGSFGESGQGYFSDIGSPGQSENLDGVVLRSDNAIILYGRSDGNSSVLLWGLSGSNAGLFGGSSPAELVFGGDPPRTSYSPTSLVPAGDGFWLGLNRVPGSFEENHPYDLESWLVTINSSGSFDTPWSESSGSRKPIAPSDPELSLAYPYEPRLGQSGDNLWVVSTIQDQDSEYHIMITRWNEGAQAQTLGTGGNASELWIDEEGIGEYAYAAVPLSGVGAAVVYCTNDPAPTVRIVYLNPNGTPATSLGNGGRTVLDLSGDSLGPVGYAKLTDGRYAITGFADGQVWLASLKITMTLLGNSCIMEFHRECFLVEKNVFEDNRSLILGLAKKYIWWENPEAALRNPYRVLAGAMNLGTLEDYHSLFKVFGGQVLAETLKKSAPGWFSPKSWSFWHRVLGIGDVSEPVPPLPERDFR